MKLKALVAAVAMAAGVAHATMPSQTDTTVGSALTFTMWNSTNSVSSLFDLGLSSTQFSYANVGGAACAADCVVNKQITWNFNTGAVLSTGAVDLSSLVAGVSGSWADTWAAYKPNVAGSVYDVFASDRDGGTAVTQHILTSFAFGSGTVAAKNSELLLANAPNIGQYLLNNAGFGNHASVANGADMVDSTSNAYQGTTGNFLTNWNGKLTNFSAADATNQALGFYSMDGVAGSSTAQVAKQNFNGTFALDEAAGTLTWTTVTAVPEPSTYAMLFAGLGLMGFMARRRAK